MRKDLKRTFRSIMKVELESPSMRMLPKKTDTKIKFYLHRSNFTFTDLSRPSFSSVATRMNE